MRWARHVACMGEIINACKILFRKPEWKRPLGRPVHRRWKILLKWVLNKRMG
jgi:hypothetical protein